MSYYRPSRLPHQVLRELAAGPMFLADIVARFETERGVRRLARKVWLIMGALQTDGFVVTTSAGYLLTPSGREALADLNNGLPVSTDEPMTSVRRFERRAA